MSVINDQNVIRFLISPTQGYNPSTTLPCTWAAVYLPMAVLDWYIRLRDKEMLVLVSLSHNPSLNLSSSWG